ncbi:MAG: peptidoglycan DD-metalloendopeptidase family protein [Bacilli bacterium]
MPNIINHVLKNQNEKITSNYGNRSFYMQDRLVSDFHKGIDLIDKNEKNDHIIAFEDGVVIETRDSVEGYDATKSAGNYVYIKHDNNYTTRYLHMKLGSVRVKKGDKVKKGSIIGYTGATGYVTGTHVHFEIRNNNIAEDPLPYLEGTNKIIKTKIYLGTKVTKDTTKDQIMIKENVTDLRVRESPNGKILGYINPGIYNIISKDTKDGYDWYQIDTDYYIAYDPKWATLYLKETSLNIDLEKQIEILKQKVEQLTKENESLKEEGKLIYTATQNDIYAIKLYQGEKLYLKK